MSSPLRRGFVSLIALGALVVIGCARLPEKEREDARTTMDAARTAEAQVYAQSSFQKAEDAWSEGEGYVTAKEYSKAREAFVRAKAYSDSASTMAAENKEKVRVEVEQLVQAVTTGLSDLKARVEGDEAKRLAKEVKEQLANDITSCESDLTMAQNLQQAGTYQQALDHCKGLKDRLQQIQMSFEEQVAAVAKKR